MADWDALATKIQAITERMQNDADTFRTNMLAEIESAKNNELHATLNAVVIRLSRIEEQLKKKDEADGDGAGKRTLRT